MTSVVEGALDLPASPRSVPAARRLARRTAARAGLSEDTTDVLQLLVSELVTNAVVHGGTPVRVRIAVDGEQIRIEVCDQAALQPTLRTHSATATTGRGLRMLSVLAQAWGVEDTDDGKLVWASLSAASSAPDDVLAARYGDVVELISHPQGTEDGRTA